MLFVLSGLSKILRGGCGNRSVLYAEGATSELIVAAISSRLLGCNYVVTCHGSDVKLGGPFHYPLQRVALKKATCVVTVSTELKAVLARKYGIPPADIRLIPNGYPEGELAVNEVQTVSHQADYILTVGRLSYPKNPLSIVRAYLAVTRRFPSVSLVVVGDGILRPTLERFCHEQGLKDQVTFLGNVPHRRVLNLMSKATIVVFSSFREGLPLVSVEALGAGRPVVASAVGGIKDFIVDGVNGLLVPVDDCQSTASALERLLGDDKLREELGRRARESVKGLAWSDIASSYSDLFDSATLTSRQRPDSEMC